MPESLDASAPKLDLRGFTLSFAALTTLIWGLIEAPARGWTDGAVLAAFAVALVVGVAFVAWERRAPSPMLDMELFRNPRFTASSAAISLAFFALFGMIFFLTQYMQMVRGYDALDAGIKTLPVAAGLVFAGPSSTKLTEKLGLRIVVPLGLVFVAGGMYLISLADATSGYGLIAAALVLLGYGIGTAMAPATDAIMGVLPEAKMSVGSAINDTTRVAGGALGVAVLGSLLASGYRGDMDSIAGAPEMARDSLAGALAHGQPAADRRRAGGVRERDADRDARRRRRGPRGRADRRRVPAGREARARAARPWPLERARRASGRPRSAEADEAILQAALELMAESGYRALTMEQVRERSGVGKATIYRRYGSKEELVAAAIVHLNSDIPLPDDTGSLQGDFAATAQSVLAGRGADGRAHADAAAAVARSSASRRCTRCSTSTSWSRAGAWCARSSSAPRRAARSARR